MAEKYFGDKASSMWTKASLRSTQNSMPTLEAMFLNQGSHQESLWGINLYPDMDREDFLELDFLINIRPMQENRSRGLELLNLTLSLSHGPRPRELLRAREVMCDFFVGDNDYQSTAKQMKQYFDSFAFARQR